MAGRYRKERIGDAVMVHDVNVPFTFWPKSRVENGPIKTLNPWRCIQVHLHQTIMKPTLRNRALAFLEQAEDFHMAANAPRVASKPLLQYYSFMNLAKCLLVAKKGLSLDFCMHGLKEPKENTRKRLTITSQAVKVNDAASGGRLHVYREFVQACGFSVPAKPQKIPLVDLLEQTVSINGVISKSMGRSQQFYPIEDIEFRYDSAEKKAWIFFVINKNEFRRNSNAASLIRDNTAAFEEVESGHTGYRAYESVAEVSYSKSPIDALPKLVASTWHDLWSELVPGGYKFWVSTIDKRKRLSQLGSLYQTMFYFGSLSRYRPDDFHKLADGKHGWMVHEFINTQPMQFTYFLGSGLLDAELALPTLTTC